MILRSQRRLHAGAWWLWAVGLVAAASQTSNPLLLGLIIAVSCLVVASRRNPTRWAGGYRTYLLMAGVVIFIRVLFRLLLGGDFGTHTLIVLPHLSLAGGVELGGVVTIEEVLAGLYDGLRLATIVVAVGAANTLADPRRLLPSLPRALGGIATSAVVALSLAPHLLDSIARVRRARRLRGESGGIRALRSILVPVLEDTLHRSLALAASMDSRGYGRATRTEKGDQWAGTATWLGLAVVCVGVFVLLTGVSLRVSLGLIIAGATISSVGLARLGRSVTRTRYRPEPWGTPEWLVVVSGAAAAVGLFVAGVVEPTTLTPVLQPLQWPSAGPLATVALLLAAVPAIAAPPLRAATPAPIVERAA